MKVPNSVAVLVLALTCVGDNLFAQPYQQSIEMRASWAPSITIINGGTTAYYELHLTNFSKDSLHLKTLRISNVADSALVMLIGERDLEKRLSKIGVSNNDTKLLMPGSAAVLYIELILPHTKSNVNLLHHLELMSSKDKKTYTVSGAEISFSTQMPLVLGAPLKAGPWAAVYEPSWERGHRRVIYTVDGKARIPGRFAIDFIKLNEQGRYSLGDENIIKNWYGYNADVLAVSDGVVAAIRQDFTESATLSAHPDYKPDEATGNYISIDIGNGNVAFYEHLKPGSIKVKPGQKVRKGEVIASLGFTGQTTGPHLHFHVADRNSPLGAEGLPFVFDDFTFLGVYVEMEKFGKEVWQTKNSNELIRKERPVPNAVIKFNQ
jgi:murein DD-endopeptidase